MNFEALAQEKDKRKNWEISFRRYYKLELSDEMFWKHSFSILAKSSLKFLKVFVKFSHKSFQCLLLATDFMEKRYAVVQS